MFSYYALFEQLPDDVLNRKGDKTPRYDLTKTSGQYQPFDELKTKKGMLYVYLIDNRGMINSPDPRRADKRLQGKRRKDTINITSLFLLNIPASDGFPIIGYGNPNGNPTLKNGNPNPFSGYGCDGFLFIVSPEWKKIEMFVVPDGNLTILSNAKALADGVYDGVVQAARAAATTFYDYWQK